MKTFRDYSDLSRQIHAPEDLKAKVLWQAAGTRKRKNGRYSRGWSFVQKAAAAAVLIVVLPLTAYAAAKGMGLTDYLAERGMKDIQAVEELSNSASELSFPSTETTAGEQGIATFRNHYAEYSILEAVCDSETIYLAARVKPLSEEYFLIPQCILVDEQSVDSLGLEGVSGGTVSEYADAHGLTLVQSSVGYRIGESHLDGSEDFRYDSDGTLYLYFSAKNLSESKDITLKCAGLAATETMSVADRVEFDVQLTNKSTSVSGMVCTSIDPKAEEETGILLNSIRIEESEMGLYATFSFTSTNAKFSDITFKLVDASGKELPYLPGEVGTGTIDNGDGTFSRTNNYQKPDAMEGLQFIIRDFSNAIDYGPYSFE